MITRLPQEDMCQALGLAPAIKYESHGGPGIKSIMDLLRYSTNANHDRDTFMRFQIFQYLIGAPDGHGKNYSLYIQPSGTYRLTPFYDVMSSYPLLGGRGMSIKRIKLAMGLHATKGKKYTIEEIQLRHFYKTARDVGFNEERMRALLMAFPEQMHTAMENVQSHLVEEIPKYVLDAIFDKTLERAAKLERLLAYEAQ